MKIATAASVSVKFLPNDDLLIVRCGLGGPAAVVTGRADVIIGLDVDRRIVNVEVDIALKP